MFDKLFESMVQKNITEKQIEDVWNTLEFKNWFGDSKVVDSDDEPLQVYHGTTKNFTSFDIEKANPEGYFGKGFYFTDDPDDASSNYHEKGGDLKNTIEKFAERITNAIEYNDLVDADDLMVEANLTFDITEEDFEKLKSLVDGEWKDLVAYVAELYCEHSGATMPVFLKMENPLIVDKHGGTIFEWEYDLDPYMEDAEEEIRNEYEDMEEEDPEEFKYYVEDRAREMAQNYDDLDGNAKELYDILSWLSSEHNIDNLWFEILDNGLIPEDGFTAYELFDVLRKSEKFMDVVDNNGELSLFIILGKLVQELGFDGVIMNTQDTDWNMDINYGTKHYIVYKPEQIKSVFNKGTFNPNSSNILESK